jgi:MFS family permease
VIEALIRAHGWRTAHLAVSVVCLVAMPPLALLLRSRPPARAAGARPPAAAQRRIDLPPAVTQSLLAVAGLACCVAMAMPQVHIVAYCGDLGYGAASGARMLSLMLGFGIVSRIASGFLADRLGGVMTLAIGSVAQMTALALYLVVDGLTPLYFVSALFGLFQGGLVPSYAIIVRESFPAREAGGRVGVILMMTLLGMALGGWMSGAIYDITGSYRVAFANGMAWNGLNLLIAVFLLAHSPLISPRSATAPRAGSAEG